MRSIATLGIPNTLRRNLCAGNQGAEFRPRDLGVRAPYRGGLGEAAVSTADDVLRADDPGEPLEPLGHQPRMLDRGRVVGDDTGDEDLAVRNLVSLRCTVLFRPSHRGGIRRPPLIRCGPRNVRYGNSKPIIQNGPGRLPGLRFPGCVGTDSLPRRPGSFGMTMPF